MNLSATYLARAGTSPRIAKTYTDAGLLPVSDAVINLPSLLAKKPTSTQIGTQSLFRAGHDLSTSDTESHDNAPVEVPGIKRLEVEDSALVPTGHENEESCRARTRSYEEELEQQALAKADSQIDSQALRDPDLARVVMAWPSLSEERKKIIGSLLNLD